jgi:hypothetical protein
MTKLTGLNSGAEEALLAAKWGDAKKKVNAESWTFTLERLLAGWGEKAAGLRWMHAKTGGEWKAFSNKLALSSIAITCVASSLSLVATSVENQEVKDGFLYGVGAVGLVSTLLQSLTKFYQADEKAAEHASISKQFGSFYRYMTLQMGMSREDRDPSDVLSPWALKEFSEFRKVFAKSPQAIPDLAEDKFIIKIFSKEDKQNDDKHDDDDVDRKVEVTNVTVELKETITPEENV